MVNYIHEVNLYIVRKLNETLLPSSVSQNRRSPSFDPEYMKKLVHITYLNLRNYELKVVAEGNHQ